MCVIAKTGQLENSQFSCCTVFFVYLPIRLQQIEEKRKSFATQTAKRCLFFFYVLFFMSFCLSAPDRCASLFESEKVFLSPRWMHDSDGAKVCIKRLRGLPRIALYIPRTPLQRVSCTFQHVALYIIYPCHLLPLFLWTQVQ